MSISYFSPHAIQQPIKYILTAIVEKIEGAFDISVSILVTRRYYVDSFYYRTLMTYYPGTASYPHELLRLIKIIFYACITTGVRGKRGMRGPTGPAGPQGERGANGSPGLPGMDGATGAKGSTGDLGPQGIAGSKGPTGDIGPAGPQG